MKAILLLPSRQPGFNLVGVGSSNAIMLDYWYKASRSMLLPPSGMQLRFLARQRLLQLLVSPSRIDCEKIDYTSLLQSAEEGVDPRLFRCCIFGRNVYYSYSYIISQYTTSYTSVNPAKSLYHHRNRYNRGIDVRCAILTVSTCTTSPRRKVTLGLLVS